MEHTSIYLPERGTALGLRHLLDSNSIARKTKKKRRGHGVDAEAAEKLLVIEPVKIFV
jgi:hypothetical protein